MDISIAVRDADFQGFVDDWQTWFAAITPTLTARHTCSGEGGFYALTPTGSAAARTGASGPLGVAKSVTLPGGPPSGIGQSSILDVAALSDRAGIAHAAEVLGRIDDYYADQRSDESEGVATQLARQLADPRPADSRTIKQLGRYKELAPRWTDWKHVTDVCRSVAVEMVQ